MQWEMSTAFRSISGGRGRIFHREDAGDESVQTHRARKTWACDFTDPDGYRLELSALGGK